MHLVNKQGTTNQALRCRKKEREHLMTDNPKTNPAGNTEKDPDDWVSGGEPMTGAQASYLKTLAEEAHRPEAFDPRLSKAEASKRIDALKSPESAVPSRISGDDEG
jgi:hypothetical protein